MNQKFLSLFLVSSLCTTLFMGCTATPTSPVDSNEDNLKITTTIFPIYDWTKNILGDSLETTELSMLLDTGVDLHSYQPTAADIIAINESDVFIYVGGDSDAWVEDILDATSNEDLVTINLMESLGDRIKMEEFVEGMEVSDPHDHDHAHGEHDHEHDAHTEHDHEHDDTHTEHDHEHNDTHAHADEHVWLSLINAQIIVEDIATQLSELTSNTDYLANAEAYISQLESLDEAYSLALSNTSTKTLLFGDRFPFRYLVDDYNLDYYAAFNGCSAETEASFDTITFLSQKVDTLDLSTVLELESTNHKISETIIANTTDKDQTILTLNSLQSIVAADLKTDISYLSVMEDNLEVLKEALK